MNLDQLLDHVGTVVYGTVIDIEQSNREIAGGTLPVLTYRLRVEDMLLGPQVDHLEFSVLGDLKGQPTADSSVRRFSVLPELPRLQVGQEYVLLLTAESAAGLCAPVGLQQGAFRVVETKEGDIVLNSIHNLGLFRGMTPSIAADSQGVPYYYAFADYVRNYLASR